LACCVDKWEKTKVGCYLAQIHAENFTIQHWNYCSLGCSEP